MTRKVQRSKRKRASIIDSVNNRCATPQNNNRQQHCAIGHEHCASEHAARKFPRGVGSKRDRNLRLSIYGNRVNLRDSISGERPAGPPRVAPILAKKRRVVVVVVVVRGTAERINTILLGTVAYTSYRELDGAPQNPPSSNPLYAPPSSSPGWRAYSGPARYKYTASRH